MCRSGPYQQLKNVFSRKKNNSEYRLIRIPLNQKSWCSMFRSQGRNLKILEPCSENVFIETDVAWLRIRALKYQKNIEISKMSISNLHIEICFAIEIQKMRKFPNIFENFFWRIWQDLDRCRKWIIYRPSVKDIWIIYRPSVKDIWII